MSSRTAGTEDDSAGKHDREKVSIEFRVSPEMKSAVGELVDANDETVRNVSQVARVLVAFALANADEAIEYGEENEVSL